MSDVLHKSADNYEPRGRLNPAAFERHVSFRTYSAPEQLSQFIEHLWTIRWDSLATIYNSEEVMHRPYVDVFVSELQSGIQGTFRGMRTYKAVGSGRIVGIRFKPGAFRAFWNGVMADLQDKTLDLQQLFPVLDENHIKQLLKLPDDAITQELTRLVGLKNPRSDPNIILVNRIINLIEEDESLQTVTAIAKRFGKSERWLQQLFQEYVGIGLKWFLQRRKLLAAAQQIRDNDQPDWASVAYDIGYSSQQHFITDFKRALGKTPVQYKEELKLTSMEEKLILRNRFV
jgi:AraC-like DNA-binding protein